MVHLQLSANQARAFVVESQLLSNRFPSKKQGTLSVIEQLGYIQIDTISVVARAHHHVLWSRVNKYQRSYLQRLEEERKIFEYWAHAASYLPMCDFRFSLVPKQKIIEGPGHWRPRNKKWNKFVLDRITTEGALMAKDFKKDPNLNEDHAWGGHPVTQALRQLFMEGRIMISGRKGFQKVYDLTERVLPESVDTSMPGKKEYYKYLIRRDLLANGLMRDREIGHLITIPQQKRNQILGELIEEDIIWKVKIGSSSSPIYYALKEQLLPWSYKSRIKKLHLLSPFDNLLIQRKRIAELFKFEYTLECYVPPAKRKIGYFALPVLYGHQFAGQVDLKADRKSGVLIIKNLVWEPDLNNKDKVKALLYLKLVDYMSFNNCEEIDQQGFSLTSSI